MFYEVIFQYVWAIYEIEGTLCLCVPSDLKYFHVPKQNSSFLYFGTGRESTENRELLCFDIKVRYCNLALQHTAGGAVFKKAPKCSLVGPGAGKPHFLLVSLRVGGRA